MEMKRRIILAMSLGCFSAACATEGDREPSSTELGSVQAAIIHGGVLEEEHSGVVRLLKFDTGKQKWYTACSGALMTNRRALTAAHCVTDELVAEGLRVKMGSQTVDLDFAVRHPDRDVAVVQFEEPLEMWNFYLDGFTTDPPQLTTNGFLRPLYSGTNASLQGMPALCLGYGGATASQVHPPLTYAVPTLLYEAEQPGAADDSVFWQRTNGQITQQGDSGGPCLSHISTFGSPVVYVHSQTLASTVSIGTGAETWGFWAFWHIIAP